MFALVLFALALVIVGIVGWSAVIVAGMRRENRADAAAITRETARRHADIVARHTVALDAATRDLIAATNGAAGWTL